MSATDGDGMAAGRLGEEEFADLYRGYRRRVHRLAVRLVGLADATDVVQEVMLRAWRCPPVISDQRQVWPWLRTVTRNLCVDLARKRREVPAPELAIEALLPLAPDEPEAAGLRTDSRRWLWTAVARLPARDAEMLRHEMTGMSAADIAAVYGSNPNAVRQSLFRARRSLARHLRDAGLGLPALLPSWIGLRRLVRSRRLTQSLPVLTGMALAAATVATYQPPQCLEVVPYRSLDNARLIEEGVALRSWVRVPSRQGVGPASHGALVYDEARHEHLLVSAWTENSGPGTTTWTWRSNRWIERHSRDRPPALRYAEMVYDSRRREAVLIGFGDDRLETWTWNGANWSSRPTALSPRRSFALAYDEKRGETVLFGGQAILQSSGDPPDFSIKLDETWIWNGVAWRNDSPPASPPSRTGASTAYDRRLGKIVLFGGELENGLPLNDMWLWNGAVWERTFPSDAPSPRSDAPMVTTPTGLLLYGGSALGIDKKDTWRWDGATWWNEHETGPAWFGLRMAYDPDRDEMMLVANEIDPHFYRAAGSERGSATRVAPVEQMESERRKFASSRHPTLEKKRPALLGNNIDRISSGDSDTQCPTSAR